MRRGLVVMMLVALAGAASAEEPKCAAQLDALRQEIADARLNAAKQAQVGALVEQAERACKANDQVVAMAGIDQVRAILKDELNTGSGS
jgi:hypothetical protein